MFVCCFRCIISLNFLCTRKFGNTNRENARIFFLFCDCDTKYQRLFYCFDRFETTCSRLYFVCCCFHSTHCDDCEWQWQCIRTIETQETFSVKIANSFWFQIRLFMCSYVLFYTATYALDADIYYSGFHLTEMEKFINYSVYKAINFSRISHRSAHHSPHKT